MYKGFLLASNGTRDHNIIQPFGRHQITEVSYESNPISASMQYIVVFLAALVCGVCCIENLPPQLLFQPKNRRGINDHSVTFPSESSSSYSTPVHSSLSSGYEFGGPSGGFSLGHAGALLNSGGSVSHGIGYSLVPSGGLGLGYQSPGLSHGSLSRQSSSLGGHSAQSSYSSPSIASFGSGGSSNVLFAPTKTGPVTFGIHGGSGAAGTSASYNRSPAYASGGHGISAYSKEGSGSLQIVLGSQHGGLSLGSPGASSSYSFPIHSASSSPPHSVTGGLIIAGGSPSSYSLPESASSHGISSLSGSSGTQEASSTYSRPLSSGISALSSSEGSSNYAASSGSYGTSSTHSGFSGASSGGTSYQLPIASGSYSGSSNNAITYTNYIPSHSSSSSVSYSSPSVSYATPSISHASSSSGSGYSGAGGSYSLSSNHVGSSSSPVVTYTGSQSYTPTYYSSSGSHGTPADSHGAYSSVSPRYFGYTPKFYHADVDSTKYDTISYSVPNGKY
ncbi:putative lysozyme-like protein [Monomorium pharaonis]|uniref:putative lysozyme-like protein n=1 Tax=Monomorium pharaonis TaxID=307658 RepID=UPI00102E206B|nr:putative lysozyme-like protein [Monomorium pharaonis]